MSAIRPDARSLFAAARDDGPNEHERDVVYRRLAVATGMAVAAAAAATAASTAPIAAAAAVTEATTSAGSAAAGGGATVSAFSIKVLAIGALIGAASTALVVFLTLAMPAPQPTSGAAMPAPQPTSGAAMPAPQPTSGAAMHGGEKGATLSPRTHGGGAKLASSSVRTRDTADPQPRREVVASGASGVVAAEAEAAATARAHGGRSDLAEEARLVTAARTALVGGDAAVALALVKATRNLGARALEPEELSLEARALRALGRADDAAATELVLRRRYPEHALAR